jgi:gluconolactonase
MVLREAEMRDRVLGVVPFTEGPVWCDDGTVVICCTATGELYRLPVQGGDATVVASLQGGANGATPAAGGGFVVCQNGGFDFAELGMPDAPPFRPVPPGLQHVAADGSVRYLAAGGFSAPNDLVVGDDNTIYFTDPPRAEVAIVDGKLQHVLPTERRGRVWRYGPDGVLTLFAGDLVFPNGIGFDHDGHVVIVEEHGLMRLYADGRREWVIRDLGPGGGDGFCLDVEGNFYVAGTRAACVRVVDPSGEIVAVLPTPPAETPQYATNCCFGGPDLRTLICTETPGRVVAFLEMAKAGRPMAEWRPFDAPIAVASPAIGLDESHK